MIKIDFQKIELIEVLISSGEWGGEIYGAEHAGDIFAYFIYLTCMYQILGITLWSFKGIYCT